MEDAEGMEAVNVPACIATLVSVVYAACLVLPVVVGQDDHRERDWSVALPWPIVIVLAISSSIDVFLMTARFVSAHWSP